jgi:hypothetical protein
MRHLLSKIEDWNGKKRNGVETVRGTVRVSGLSGLNAKSNGNYRDIF